MHEHKLLEFNPLDLLATAATLQRPGREVTVDPPDVPEPPPPQQQQTDLISNSSTREDYRLEMRHTRSNGNLSGSENNNNSSSSTIGSSKPKLLRKSDADLKIYKVVVKNELSKMLEEHNYGHPKRNFRYILDDEPFSSADKERELKLMDSNCNEYTEYLENCPQALCKSFEHNRPDDDQVDNACDKNSNTLAISRAELDCGEDSITCTSDVDREGSKTTDIEVDNLELLRNANKTTSEMGVCSSLFRDEDSGDEPSSSASEGKQVADDTQGKSPQETCDTDSAQADNKSAFTVHGESDKGSWEGSDNTLDGFIVSDSCIGGPSEQDTSCDSSELDSQHTCERARRHERDMCENTKTKPDTCSSCQSVHSGQNVEGNLVTGELLSINKSVLCARNGQELKNPDGASNDVMLSNSTDLCASGRGKKQTIIRSLLTGETIVVMQKSQTESSMDCSLTEDLSTCSSLRDGMESLPLVQSMTTPPPCENDERKVLFKTLSPTGSNLTDKVGHVLESRSELSKALSTAVSTSVEGPTLMRPSITVHQSNKNTVVVSPTQLSVPLTIGNLKSEKRLPALESALLSKLTSTIKQRRSDDEETTPTTILADSRLGQLSIGQFASVSSSKIGLVRIQAVHNVHPSKLDIGGRTSATKAHTLSSQQSHAYQQVLKQFPNLVKPNRDEILKVAVAPDDVLDCVPSAGMSAPATEDHVLHDHDYCMKLSPRRGGIASLLYGDVRFLSGVGREPKLGRPPKNAEKKRKYVKKDTDVLGSRSASPVDNTNMEADFANIDSETEIKPAQGRAKRSSRQKSGRDSSPGESPDSPDIDGQTDGAKVKITGSFQDDFVYFINKTSRNRRRTSEKLPVPVLPVPNAADIFIPHLSDADIAALKDKPIHPTSLESSASKGGMTDEDSSVINTILSMENSIISVDPRTDGQGDGFGSFSVAGDALNGLDLTPEQMDILFSAIDGADSDAVGHKFDQNKFVLDTDHADLSDVVTSADIARVIVSNSELVLKSTPCTKSSNSFGDTGVSLLGTEDNLHVSNMNLILSDASQNKSNLPTLDPTEVQDSISAITSTRSSPTDMGHMDTIPSSSSHHSSSSPTILTTVTTNSDSSKSVFADGIADLSLPSLEKSLDFMGDKTELFSDVGLSQASNTATNDNSPWIVTVSMYWNDLPAVMLDNQPYVRLVDIYKQILPAKDTGILKKRCQLLGMEVKNCSEMHRYFLVKYGRGYNSKSTLVVSKDNAKRLIGFYVEPQSRVVKSEGGLLDKIPSSPATPVPPQKPRLVSEASCDSSTSGEVSPVLHDSKLDAVPLEAIKRERTKSATQRAPARRPAVTILATESVSKRLRHKKINFRNMLQGIKVDEEASTSDQSTVTASTNNKQDSENLKTVTPKTVECEAGTVEAPQRRRSKSNESSTVSEPRRRSKSNETEKSDTTCTIRQSVPDEEAEKPSCPTPPVPPRRRSITPRRTLKPCRPHPRGLKLRPNKSYNVLGRQLRRGNGMLYSVLKKHQLNGTHHKSTSTCTKSVAAQENCADDRVSKVAKFASEELPPIGVNSTHHANVQQRQRLANVSDADNVRSSSRKRKLKQLYPIENYSYAKVVRKSVSEDDQLPARDATCHRGSLVRTTTRPLRTSPRKKKTDNTSSMVTLATSPSTTSEDEENRPKNVITLINGPEFDTFTALSSDFSI